MKKFIVTCFLLLQYSVQSQSYGSLINSISSELKKVETNKLTVEQEISTSKEPLAAYVLKETSKKGKVQETIYEFNFADIDVNTVRYKTSKDKIQVQLIAKQNQKMIKKLTDRQKVSYVKELFFVANDADNARTLVETIKTTIPVAKKITENKLSLYNYDDRVTWLTKNIQEVISNDKGYKQKFTIDKAYPANVFLSNTVTKKSSTKKLYGFNLANLNASAVKLKNKGNNLIISVETKRGLKAIKVLENGEQKNYTNKFEIVCSDIENAREIQKVLQDIIPLAQKKFESSLPTISSVSSGFDKLNLLINKIEINNEKIIQNIKGDCVVQLKIFEETAKSQVEKKYEFNFIDINKNTIELSVRGKKILVKVHTNAKNKFIKYVKNNELQSYVNNVEIVFNSIEDAVIGRRVLQTLTESCSKNKPSFTTSFNSLKEEIGKVSDGKLTYEQNLEKLADGLIKFTSTKISDKKSDETIQEFKLTDMSPSSVKMKVSGKKVMVELATNYQEKIVKTYKNGEIKSYTNKVTVFCNSIENGRKIVSVLREIVGKK